MGTRTLIVALAVLLSSHMEVGTVFAASGDQRSRSDKDIAAIGHRNIGGNKGLGNWYSLEREKEMGKQLSAEVERSFRILDDPAIAEYVARVAENISKNSDAQIPITIRLLDREQVEAFTLPGGYQYLTRGLLLQLENESELASVLARGIAHTALRSSTRLMTRTQYANIGLVPIVLSGSGVESNNASGSGLPVTVLKFRRGFESAADYFGVQYLYKAGYRTESFCQIVQRIWPANPASVKAFSPFPPTPDRLKALQAEISELMTKRDGEIVSTPEFEEFRKRLRSWKPSEPVPIQSEGKPHLHE